MTPENFVLELASAATQVYQLTGIYASIILAQAALESGWLTKFPVDKYTGKVSYNAFGIKGIGPNGSVKYDSKEVRNGKIVMVENQFRVYNDYEESMVDHARFLLEDRYKKVIAASSPEEAARQLQLAGYATDPEYANKLIRIINQYNFKKYDIKKEGEKVREAEVIVDFGHGGTSASGLYDPGACGSGLKEADLVSIIGNAAIKELNEKYVVNAYAGNRSDSLLERVNAANGTYVDENGDTQFKVSYFCSIHVNAGGGTGFESFIYTGAQQDTRQLASAVHSIVANFYAKNGFRDRGIKTGGYTVLARTGMPAILLENLFIDRETDVTKLKDNNFLIELGKTIGIAIGEALVLPKKQIVINVDPTLEAIKKLQSMGAITTPDYWITNAKPGKVCDGGYVARVFQNITQNYK